MALYAEGLDIVPEKKNQHLVPACYLRRFEADVSEMRKSNPNYSSGIYVNDNNLSSGWKLRSVTHKSLTRPYFYNLPEDNPKDPLIENFLSVIEGKYKKYSEEIINGTINNENMSFMSYFVTLQFMRVESFLESIQSSFDKAGEWMDSFSGGNYHSSAMRDVAKKQLTEIDLGHVLHPNAAIIYNNANFPFVTSDNPVIRRHVNIVDAREIIPERYLHIENNESREFLFFLMPLSPAVVYISCEVVKFKEGLIYSDNDLENIFYINFYSIVNSYKKVYSSVIEPIKGEKQLSEYLSSKNGTIFKIYTQSKRVICKGTMVNSDNYSVSLQLADLDQVSFIKKNEQISLVEIIEDGVSIRGMRDCKFSSVNYANGVVTIESNVKLGI
ncbi:DUF4238 domain-containing protein [Marinobacterium sp. AK62]|uniref:DUF4238 domain-containing protein n=1 Tax=Marinobacterium alkalitolerans TaxID=1542925 RepID=A0ABS3Z709_9GAMM|nr:DUF4238 domain-containing protein [Marinobacterium alkalitolerans]MBP0047498.1 DUF4238 domain-containing protein [Marinobacterium alkalitolerans]